MIKSSQRSGKKKHFGILQFRNGLIAGTDSGRFVSHAARYAFPDLLLITVFAFRAPRQLVCHGINLILEIIEIEIHLANVAVFYFGSLQVDQDITF